MVPQTISNRMKKALFAGILIVLISCTLVYYMFNKSPTKIDRMATDFQLTAETLLLSFEDDETIANDTYLDKVIEVTGKVAKAVTENGKTTIYLDTGNDLSQIICQLERNDSSIKEGDYVAIKGICTGYLMDVVLVRATKIIN